MIQVGLALFIILWWIDETGNHPEPFTIITQDDLTAGIWRPLVAPNWSASYVKMLNEMAKKELVIWPYHVPIGGIGNALDPTLWSAVFWHSIARQSQPTWLIKGSLPRTEHYSIIKPEIPILDQPGGSKSRAILDVIARGDVLILAGEAKSHCVLETIADLVTEYADRPEFLRQIFVLEDCMSSIPHPEARFHEIATKQFAKFTAQGVNIINSTDPLPF
jgi:nicotinamidase-related amidase